MKSQSLFKNKNTLQKKELSIFTGLIHGHYLNINENQVMPFLLNTNPTDIEKMQIQYLTKHFAIIGPQKYLLNFFEIYFQQNYSWQHPIIGDLDNFINYINSNWDESNYGQNLVKAFLEDRKLPSDDSFEMAVSPLG